MGDIIINNSANLSIDGNVDYTRVNTWKTDGYNLTVGGNLKIGQGSDTGLKTLDATNYSNPDPNAKSTITIGGNWLNYGNGTAPSQFIAATSTVVFTGTGSSNTITSGTTTSPFYNLQLNGAGSTFTLQDNLAASGSVSHLAGTLNTNGKNIITTGNLTISDGALVAAAGLANSRLTVGGNFSAAGHSGALLTLNQASTWYLKVAGTANVSFANVAYSDASGGTAISQTNSTDGGHNVNWNFDLVAPSTSAAGTTGGNFYNFGDWTSQSVSVVLSCADNSGGSGCATGYPKYCVDTSNLCSPVTTGTSYSALITVSSQGTTYIRYYSQDAAGNSETVQSVLVRINALAPQMATTTISGFKVFGSYLTGSGTVMGGTAVDAGGSGINTNSCQYTIDGGAAWSTAAWITDHCEKNGLTIADGNYYTFNTRVSDNSGITGTGTSTITYIGDLLAPVTSDNSDTVAHGADLAITLTPTDAGSGVAATNYCVDTAATCTPATVGTTVNLSCPVGQTCAQYVRYFSTDHLGNIETIKTSNQITIDKALPVISNVAPAAGTAIAYAGQVVTFTTDKAATCRYSVGTAKSYDEMASSAACAVANGIQMSCTLPELAVGTENIFIGCEDYLGNKTTAAQATQISYSVKTQLAPSSSGGGSMINYAPVGPFSILINGGKLITGSRLVELKLSAGTGVTAAVISTNPDFSAAEVVPVGSADQTIKFDLCSGQASCPDRTYTVYVKFLSANGAGSRAVAASISLYTGTLTDLVSKAVSGIADNISERVSNLLTLPKPEQEAPMNFPPLNAAVPQKAPLALQQKLELAAKPLHDFVMAPLPKDFLAIANKFDQVANTLNKVGLTRLNSAKELEAVKISLPGLAEVVGTDNMKNLTLAELSKNDAVKVPTGIVFARSQDLDLNVKLSVSNSGLAVQTLTTVQGRPLTLAVKPDHPAAAIKGYLIYKSNQVAASSSPRTSLLAAALLSAGIKISGGVGEAPKDLVLSSFDYHQSGNGIWTADVASPMVLGQYELRTVVDYTDKKQSPSTVSMVVVVDPEGYVYRKLDDGTEARIPNAVVSIYWQNPATKKYELWPAKDFRQENPQTTDITGRYSFLVPVGSYYLTVKASGYSNYQSEVFKVEENNGVFMNIELKSAFAWKLPISLQNILLAGILLALIYLAACLRKRRMN